MKSGPNCDRLTVLSCLAAVGLGSYLLLEPPRWWLLPLTLAMGVGAWLLIKDHPTLSVEGPLSALAFAPLPALIAPAAALSLEPVLQGGWVILGAAAAGALVFGAVAAEWHTVVLGRRTARARVALNLLCYLAAFALYNSTDLLGFEGAVALGWVGVVTVLLSVELIREGATDNARTWLYALASGVVLMEIRWTVAFWPLEGTMAAIFLVPVFYLVTGVIHSYFAGQLNRSTMLEFVGATGAGLAILFGARQLAG
ncbi:MAG: hypothetical protein HYX92_19950 [Chloroflexi bacterium]|nr:hypothetical protein [Chloroflexota bacterium]